MCENNTTEYEAIILGLEKAIELIVVVDTTSTSKGNLIQKGVVSLENLYDLQSYFRGPVNAKTHSSTFSHDHISLGAKKDLKYVNLSACCTPQERQGFICIFNQYCDVFA